MCDRVTQLLLYVFLLSSVAHAFEPREDVLIKRVLDLARETRRVMDEIRSESSIVEELLETKDAPYAGYGTCSGRLTLASGTPVTTSDLTAQGTIYFTPYNGSRISLYDGTKWVLHDFTQRSLALTVSSGSNYDVFMYDNAGTLTLELSAAWTNDTTRSDALTTLSGIHVKNAATTRRYLGTIRGSGANVTEDSVSKRFVWNHCNRRPRFLRVVDTTDSWTSSTTTWRHANNSSANRVEYVVGQAEPLVHVFAMGSAYTLVNLAAGVGVDVTNANSAALKGNMGTGATPGKLMAADYAGQPGLGYHFIAWLEILASGTVTFYGDNGGTGMQLGMVGTIEG